MDTNIQTAVPAAPVEAAALQTYEDCLNAINTLENDTNVDNLKAGMKKLKYFFENRVKKKDRKRSDDGFGITKKAIESGRTFSRFEPKPLASDAQPK